MISSWSEVIQFGGAVLAIFAGGYVLRERIKRDISDEILPVSKAIDSMSAKVDLMGDKANKTDVTIAELRGKMNGAGSLTVSQMDELMEAARSQGKESGEAASHAVVLQHVENCPARGAG